MLKNAKMRRPSKFIGLRKRVFICDERSEYNRCPANAEQTRMSGDRKKKCLCEEMGSIPAIFRNAAKIKIMIAVTTINGWILKARNKIDERIRKLTTAMDA